MGCDGTVYGCGIRGAVAVQLLAVEGVGEGLSLSEGWMVVEGDVYFYFMFS